MTALTDLTAKLDGGGDLSVEEVRSAVAELLGGGAGDETKAAFLTALARKGETAAEIAAFALELRARAIDPQIDPTRFGGVVFDVVGTGADRWGTFNISTGTMFIVAAAGIAVAKHGNRAVTSQCGSADVLAALGARIELTPAQARHCLETIGLAFFLAPAYHPAFQAIGPVRRQLAARQQRTVFNVLGPLVNPARPTHQLVGVFDCALVAKYAEVLRLLGLKRALVVHGDGLDELSTLGPNTVAELWGGRIELTERDFRVPRATPRVQAVKPAELAGGDPATCAQILRDVLSGQHRGPRREIVLLNAAAALVVVEKATDFAHGWQLAGELIDSGAVMEELARFVELTNRC